MFRKILIANRGEIACRIMRTAHRMGVRTVAVYSDADRNAAHVEMADEARHVGGPRPSDSYLRIDRIVEAALDAGAEAIHPGYGFLSENPDFVDAIEAAGLTFIGPSAPAIRAMGLKDAAKRLMEEAGVPVVPGYQGDAQDDAVLEKAAREIGYPVLIKAVAGGGGKGMRAVADAAEFPAALEGARSEAKTAFGNDAVLVEKLIDRPRHVEVQVFGDGKHAIHLFERDCSLQRRHQKVIEEAPAPGMSDAVRAAMGQAAVRAAEAIGYAGAGTVEFIADASSGLREDAFWFMEMNTRLQVEHPVTEAITGQDLVEWQLRVAAGEPLPVPQQDLSIRGHAIEARLYAEDVPGGFLPATGRLDHLAFPDGLRADSGVRTGDEITAHYDPMIAKLVAWGDTREAALSRLAQGLERTEVAGAVTNLSFLRNLIALPEFVSGDVDTGLIGRAPEATFAAPVAEPGTCALAAVGAMGLGSADPLEGFSLWGGYRQKTCLSFRGEPIEIELEYAGGGRYLVDVAGAIHEVTRRSDHWEIDGAVADMHVRVGADWIGVFGQGSFVFGRVDPLVRAAGATEADGVTRAPMPGLVRALHVKPGDTVAAGDRLLVLEAMKMEHTLVAGRDGKIAELLIAVGAQVAAGDPLVVQEAVE